MKLSQNMQQLLDNTKKYYGVEFQSPETLLTVKYYVKPLMEANSKTIDALIMRGLVAETFCPKGYYYLYLTELGYATGNSDNAETTSKRNVCPKCDGKGIIKEYSHVSGGICFHCNGTGKAK